MGVFTSKPQSDLAPKEYPPEGLWAGRFYAIVDLGTHDDTYEGATTQKRKFYLGWELECRMSNGESAGKPFVVGKEFTLTNGKYIDDAGFNKPYISKNSNLKKLIKAWLKLPDEKCKLGDLEESLGSIATIQIEEGPSKKDATKKVSWLSAVLPGKSAPPPFNEVMVYSLDMGENEVFEKLYPWMKEKINKSYEKQGKTIPARQKTFEPGKHDDDCPF